jgi:hypothetical protein
MANTGDTILLFDCEDTLVDQMAYEGGAAPTGWTCGAANRPIAADGQSVARSPANTDTDTCDDWVDNQTPTPGAGP